MSYIGKITGGQDVSIGHGSPNGHIIITGISGSGKSVRIADIERHIIKDGGTVVVLDVNGTHAEDEVTFYHHISAQEDGIDVQFLDRAFVDSGQETMMNLVEYIMETICPRQLRGACQLASVRKAIEFAIRYRHEFSSDMEAIACGLKMQDDAAALGAYNHLCSVLEGNIFRNSEKSIVEEKANIISLKGLNPKTQKRVIEIVLHALWRKIRVQGQGHRGFTLVLDEFQNMDFYPGSVLFQMLTEVRKYGINLILATQTLTIFTKKELAVIEQAATKLFFQQSTTDIKKVADLIEPGHREKWLSVLSRLRIGQAVAVGELEVNGRRLAQPVVTSSMYYEGSSEKERIIRPGLPSYGI